MPIPILFVAATISVSSRAGMVEWLTVEACGDSVAWFDIAMGEDEMAAELKGWKRWWD